MPRALSAKGKDTKIHADEERRGKQDQETQKGSTSALGTRVLKQPKRILQCYVPVCSPAGTEQTVLHTSSLLLLTLSNSASASPSFIHLCLQICSMERRLLGSKTSMWRIRCSHSAREERGWVTCREGHDFCRRQPCAAKGKALLRGKSYIAKTLLLLPRCAAVQPPTHRFAADVCFPHARKEATQATGPLCCLPEPLGGTLSPRPSPPVGLARRQDWLLGVEGQSILLTSPTQQQLAVNDFSTVRGVCCQRGGLLRLSPTRGGI